MRLLIAAVFSALLLLTPHDTPVNKQSVRTVAHKVSVAVEPTTPTQPTQTQPEQPVADTQLANAPTPPTLPTVTGDDHATLMALAGISSDDFGYVDYIVSHESSWNLYATEPTSGAYGLCQSLPASKMASAGSDWQDNPVTQLSWCNSYAVSAYGSWYGAYLHWVSYRWW